MGQRSWDDLLLISRGARLDAQATIARHKKAIMELEMLGRGANLDDVLPSLEGSERSLADTIRLIESLVSVDDPPANRHH